MNAIKNALSFQEFSERGEWLGQQSFIAGWLERLNWPALDVVDDELMTRTRSTSKFPEFNNVFTTRINKENLERDVERCLETLAEEGAPTRWYLSGESGNTTVAEQLTQLGFDDLERYTIMATNLGLVENEQAEAHEPNPATSRRSASQPRSYESQEPAFDLVQDESTLKKWTETLAKILGYSKALETDWLDMLLCGGFKTDRPWRQYYCKQDGEIVGVLSAFWTEQLVSIEAIGVVRRYRGNSLGSRLLQFALDDALCAGYSVVAAFPADYQHGFFHKNLFQKFGAIDCVAIGASQLTAKKLAGPQASPTDNAGSQSLGGISTHN